MSSSSTDRSEAQRFSNRKIRVLYQQRFLPFKDPVSDADEDSIVNRRKFLSATATAGTLALAKPVFGRKAASPTLSHKERVDRALRGEDLDRPPLTFYHHYKRPTAQLEAQDHLEFHRTYNTDKIGRASCRERV